MSNWHCHLCCLLHIWKSIRFFGGPNWPKICVWGTKCNFKDWEKFAPWDLEERRTDLEGQRHRTSRSHSAASRLVLYLGAGDIIEKIIDSWHMSIFSSYLKIISIKKNIFGNCHKLSISKNVHPISSDKVNWKHCSKNKKVFHIPEKYDIVFEISAQSCAAILAEHVGL